MREILFRGKRRDTGEWSYGSLQCFKGFSIFDNVWNSFVIVDSKTVGQFTGLIDKNGNKIFEGDIVKTKYGRLCIVVWFSSQVHNGWDLETIRTVGNCAYTKYPDAVDLYKKENLEVIGNIHDNPELLEVK